MTKIILLDLNQVIIASLMVSAPGHNLDENMMRHITLNTIRAYRNQFKSEYGSELIICCDNKITWRKSYFPFYKAHRKKDREKSPYDWHVIFDSLNKIRAELKEYFPYKVIDVESAEADDVIGTLAKLIGNTDEKVLIISSDKDFIQLQKFKNVAQFSPILKKFIKSDHPLKYVKEHIIKGDRGDGIPNFLSEDKTFVLGDRQRTITKKKFDEFMSKTPEQFCINDEMLRGYKRNQTLIDLDHIPVEVSNNIIEEYRRTKTLVPMTKTMNYFIQFKLKNLMELIHEFR